MEPISTFFSIERDPAYRIGEQKGEHEKALAIAQKMKVKKRPITEIMELTELSKEEIEKL